MQEPGNSGHDGGQHLDDQSGKSLSVHVQLDSASRGFNSGRSPSVEFGTAGGGSALASATWFSLWTNIPTPDRYNAFVKTGATTTGIKSATLVKLFLVPVGSLGNTLCGGRIGESGLQAYISSTSPSSSGCAIQRHAVKETRLMEGNMYIPASSSFVKLSVFLEPSLSVTTLPPSKVQYLLLEERSAKAWTSLLPRITSLPESEPSLLATDLDKTTLQANDYLSPSKSKRAPLITVDSFENSAFLSSGDPLLTPLLDRVDTTILSSVLPVIVKHSDAVSTILHLVGRAVVGTTEFFSEDLSSLEVEVGLLQDTLGVDPGLADIQLCTAWEGLQWLHSRLKTLESTFGSNQGVSVAQVSSIISASLSSINTKIVDIESVILEEMARLNNLFVVCSGGECRPAGEALITQFNLIASRLSALEVRNPNSSSVFKQALPSIDNTSHSEVLTLQADLSFVIVRQREMQACIGQHSVEIGGIRFESLPQTTTWVRSHLLSGAYFLFMDVPILLDIVTSSNMSDKEFLDEKYQASRGRFENETVAKIAASFNRELPSIFGRVDSTSSGGQLASTHPLPLIKLRESFNAPDNQSGIKQRILLELDNIVNSISTDILSSLAGAPRALMLAQKPFIEVSIHHRLNDYVDGQLLSRVGIHRGPF